MYFEFRMRGLLIYFEEGISFLSALPPCNFLYLLKSDTGQQNYGNYNNPEYDALLIRSNSELDLKKRAETFAEAEDLMLNDYPITPMWFQVTKNLVDPDLTGYEDNAKDQHRSRFMCKDGIKAAE